MKLAATGLTLQQIAAAAGGSTATVRVALGRVTPGDQVPVEPDVAVAEPRDGAGDADLVVLAAPVPRTADRVAARFGDLVEAPVVITEGAQLPLAGLLLALPALEMTGLLSVSTEVFPPMRKGFYGLRATLLMGVFLALLREPRARRGRVQRRGRHSYRLHRHRDAGSAAPHGSTGQPHLRPPPRGHRHRSWRRMGPDTLVPSVGDPREGICR